MRSDGRDSETAALGGGAGRRRRGEGVRPGVGETPAPSSDPVSFSDERVALQVALASAQHGEGFDVVPLGVTLLLHRVTAMLIKSTTLDLAPLQLPPTDFNVLVVLHRAKQMMTMRELADTVSVRPPNLTIVVNNLIDRGLVSKTISARDRRSFLVRATPTAHAMMREFLPTHWHFMSEFYGGLTYREQCELARLLDRLLGSLRDDGESPSGIPARVMSAIHAPSER